MLVLEGILLKFAPDQLLDLLEDLDVVLGDQSHSTTGSTCSCSPAYTVNVVFTVAWDVKVNDNIH
jgi:hypothetical protein